MIHVNARLLKSDSSDDRKDLWNRADDEVTSDNQTHNLSGITPPKYKVFRDEDAPIIFDVDEERDKMNLQDIIAPQEDTNPFDGINLERKHIYSTIDTDDSSYIRFSL